MSRSTQESKRLVRCATLALCLLPTLAPIALAVNYAFTSIYSGAGAQILDGAINNSGTVMFERTLAGVTGLYTGIGGPLTRFVDTTQSTTVWYPGSYGDTDPGFYITANYPPMYAPTIDDSGRVLFTGEIGYATLFASTGGAAGELTDLGPGALSVWYPPNGRAPVHYSNSGLMAIGQNRTPGAGMFVNTLAAPVGSRPPLLPHGSLPIPPNGSGALLGAAINNSQEIVAYSPISGGGFGDVLLKYQAGSWDTSTNFALIDKRFTIDPYTEVPALNNVGDIVYVGPSLALGFNGRQLLLYHNGSVSILSDGLHGLTSFSSLGVNDHGAIVFTALGPTGALGVYWGPDAADKVVAIGDAFDGSIVTGLTLFNRSLNNDGLIAFSATLADGRSGAYTAAPIPEPSTFVLCGIAAASLFACRLVRRRKCADDVQGLIPAREAGS